MPDSEQLGIMCVLGLLMVLYVIGFLVYLVVDYWYVLVAAFLTLVSLRLWWRRRHPVYLDDENEDDGWEPVPQE